MAPNVLGESGFVNTIPPPWIALKDSTNQEIAQISLIKVLDLRNLLSLP
jgi:hypothetical protein